MSDHAQCWLGWDYSGSELRWAMILVDPDPATTICDFVTRMESLLVLAVASESFGESVDDKINHADLYAGPMSELLAEMREYNVVKLLGYGSAVIDMADPVERARELQRYLDKIAENFCARLPNVLVVHKPTTSRVSQPPVWPHLLAFHYVRVGATVKMVNPTARTRFSLGRPYSEVLGEVTAKGVERARARGTGPAKGAATIAKRRHIEANFDILANVFRFDPHARTCAGPIISVMAEVFGNASAKK